MSSANSAGQAAHDIETAPRQTSFLRAMGWMVLALAMFSAVAISGREAGYAIAAAAGRSGTPDFGDTLQIMLVRSIVGVVVASLLIAISKQGFRQINVTHISIHAARNGAHYIAQFCWFHALGLIALSQLFAIEFTAPLWVALFAWLMLGERFTPWRVAAVACGFCGILAILRPGAVAIDLGSAFALTAAIGFALSMIATKRLMATETALAVLFHMAWMQLIISVVLAAPYLTWQPWDAYAWMIGVGLTSLAAHFALARAFSEGDAMIVAPMDFLRLPLISVIGALAYSEAIAPEVAIGAGLILLGNSLNLWGQHRAQTGRRAGTQIAPRKNPEKIPEKRPETGRTTAPETGEEAD